MVIKYTIERNLMKNVIKKVVFLSLGILIVSCGKIENFTEIDSPRYVGNYAPILSYDPTEIKIVSFNIEFAQKIEEAIEELRTSENLESADIIFLQEMDEVGTEAIAKALEYNYVYYPSNRNTDGQFFGLSILAKWPIVEDEKIILPHEKPINGRKNIGLSAEIMLGSQTVRVYNIHAATFILPKSKRRDQYRTLIGHLNELEKSQTIENVIIAGDFNTDKSNDIEYLVDIHEVEGFQWASEEIGPTYQTLSGFSKFTLDHVFIRGFDLLGAGKNKETKASDHLPIWIDMKF